MSTLVRVDQTSGYAWVDFYVDQANRWTETLTLWPGDPGVGSPIDLSGYQARFVVIRAGLEDTPVLDLTSPADITLGGLAGTVGWDVPAGPMGELVHPVYQHELRLIPAGDDDLAVSRIKGRVLVRATVIPVSPPTSGVGFGHGPWGHFPWGHS